MKTIHLLTLIGISASIIASIYFIESIQGPGTMQENKTYHIYFPGQPSPILYSPFKKTVSGITEAESIVGYNIGTPTYFPQGYSMQDVLVFQFNSTKYAEILASNFPITENTTDFDFYRKGGIIINAYHTPADFNLTSWTSLQLKQSPSLSPIQFSGYSGVVEDMTKGIPSDKDIDNPANLVVIGNGEMLWIRGLVHSDELIKIAGSMLAR